MIKSFQKSIILESCKAQKARNESLKNKIIEYLKQDTLTVGDLKEVAHEIDELFPAQYTRSFIFMLEYGGNETLHSALSYDNLKYYSDETLVSEAKSYKKVLDLFLSFGEFSLIA
jgi:hypothetical protein